MCCLPLAEVESCSYHAGVVENHQRPLGQVIGQMTENILADASLTVYQQLAHVSLGKGEFGYPLVREGIVVVLDVYVLRLHICIFVRKVTLFC